MLGGHATDVGFKQSLLAIYVLSANCMDSKFCVLGTSTCNIVENVAAKAKFPASKIQIGATEVDSFCSLMLNMNALFSSYNG